MHIPQMLNFFHSDLRYSKLSLASLFLGSTEGGIIKTGNLKVSCSSAILFNIQRRLVSYRSNLPRGSLIQFPAVIICTASLISIKLSILFHDTSRRSGRSVLSVVICYYALPQLITDVSVISYFIQIVQNDAFRQIN